MKIAREIARTVKKLQFENINLGRKIGIGADGTPTEYIDKITEDIAIKYVKKSNLAVNILSEEA
ncbi:MAG TPA: sugar kinase, partial [Methanomicrobia archaeon]|nr:sugar kinase [Methanomicrobia archaeon]